MAFPTTSLLDDFNRGDSSSLGSNWTEGDCEPDTPDGIGFQISSNTAKNSGGISASARWNVSTFGADSEVYTTMNNVPTGDGDRFMIYARIVQPGSSTFDGYALCLRLTVAQLQFRLIRWDDGSRTDIATQAVTFNAGDKMGLEIIGSTLKGYRYNGSTWSQEITTTDSNHTAAGYLGFGDSIGGVGGPMEVDDFSGGTVVAGGGGTVPIIMQQMQSRMLEEGRRIKKWYERKSGLLFPDKEIFPVPVLVTR